MRGLFIAFLACGVLLTSFAQDIHFSQYYATPLVTNPANTGNIDGTFRIAGIYRNQWLSVIPGGTPYSTMGASFDMPILKGKIGYDQMGVGLSVVNDRSAAGALTNLSVMASFAYHKVLDSYNRHSLGLGIQGGIVQKRLDYSKLLFENQFVDTQVGFDPSSFNGEGGAGNSMLYADLQVGILWRSRLSKFVSVYGGIAAAHLHRPKEEFLSTNDEINRLGIRYTANFGGELKLSTKMSILPSVLFMYQSSVFQVNGGAAFAINIDKDNTFYVGPWLRGTGNNVDAFVIMAAYEMYGARVGVSYDVNLSDLRSATNSVGGIEVSLIYVHKEKNPDYNPTKFCPKF